jgi:hypothetical protein
VKTGGDAESERVVGRGFDDSAHGLWRRRREGRRENGAVPSLLVWSQKEHLPQRKKGKPL